MHNNYSHFPFPFDKRYMLKTLSPGKKLIVKEKILTEFILQKVNAGKGSGANLRDTVVLVG